MRYYTPGQNEYISQFAQLPLDWMYENIKSQQAERDAAMAGLESSAIAPKYIVSGLRGAEQNQYKEAKELMDEYDADIDKIANTVITDPRSGKRATADVAKLKYKYEHDQRYVALEQNKELMDASLKTYADVAKTGKYASDLYLKEQNAYKWNPRDEQGNMNMFVPDTEYAQTQDVAIFAKNLIGKIAESGTSYADLGDWGGMGIANISGKTVGVDEAKAKNVSRNLIDPFINSVEGQYWMDGVVQKYYPGLRKDYHVNLENLRGVEIPDQDIEYKNEDGKVVSKRKMNVADLIEMRAADYLFNVASTQIGEVSEKHIGISQYSDARMEDMKPGISSYDQAPGINAQNIVGEGKFGKQRGWFDKVANAAIATTPWGAVMSMMGYKIFDGEQVIEGDPAAFIAHASTVLGPKMAKEVLYDKDGNPKIIAKDQGGKVISNLTKEDWALLETAQKNYDRQEATLHKVNEDKTSGRLTTSQTLAMPGGVYETGKKIITTTADKILSTEFNAPIISSTANPNYKGTLRDIVTEFVSGYDDKDVGKITISMNGTADEANHFGNTDLWTVVGPDGKSLSFRSPSHRLDIEWDKQTPENKYYEFQDNLAANMGIASKYQKERKTSYIPLGFQSTKAFLQEGLYSASTEAQKEYFDGSGIMSIKTEILGGGQVEVSVYDPSSGKSKKITHIYDGSGKKIPLNITNVKQLENKDLSNAILESVLEK